MNTVVISGWCNDRCTIGNNDPDYVPDDCGIGGGDELAIEVDIETGKIVGWKPERMRELLVTIKLIEGTYYIENLDLDLYINFTTEQFIKSLPEKCTEALYEMDTNKDVYFRGRHRHASFQIPYRVADILEYL